MAVVESRDGSYGYGGRRDDSVRNGNYGFSGDRHNVGGAGGAGCYNCGDNGHLARDCIRSNGISGGGATGFYTCCAFILVILAWDCSKGNNGGGDNGNCFECGGIGHLARDCIYRAGGGSGTRTGPGACCNCGGFRHLTRDCNKASGGGRKTETYWWLYL